MPNILGTNLASAIAPYTTNDAYATHDSFYGKGGWREVPAFTDLVAITIPRLRQGMMAVVQATNSAYRLNASSASLANLRLWAAGVALLAGVTVIDSNGNLQTVTTPGTTGGTVPTWNLTGTTTDNSVVWTKSVAWSASSIYDIGVSLSTVTTVSQLILRILVRPNTLTYAINFAGSTAITLTTATASTVFSINKNDVQIGTVTYGIGSVTGTFALAAPVTFVGGTDILSIVGPAVPDITLAGWGIVLSGTRT